jgi:tetratricopeptide (TPR) repeat protein
MAFLLAGFVLSCRETTLPAPGNQDPSSAGGRPRTSGSSPARFLIAAGDAALEEGRLDEARRRYEEAASLARETSEPAQEILALNQLGVLAERQGALEDGADHYQRALVLQQGAGGDAEEALLRTNFAGLLLKRGDVAGAEREARRALELARPESDPAASAAAYRQLGRIERRAGRLDEACSDFASAATLADRAGNSGDEGLARLELGRTLLDRRDARHAVQQLSLACDRLDRTDERRGKVAVTTDRVVALRLLAEAYDQLKEPATALVFRERAIEAARAGADDETRKALLDDGIAAAGRLGRGDLARTWRNERASLPGAR